MYPRLALISGLGDMDPGSARPGASRRSPSGMASREAVQDGQKRCSRPDQCRDLLRRVLRSRVGIMGAKYMRHGALLKCLALAAAILVAVGATGTRADECDDAIAKIKQRIDGLR